MFKSIDELVTTATNQSLPLSEVIINQEILTSGKSREQIFQRMRNNLATMKAAVERGTSGQGVHSATGLTGGQAVKVKEYRQTHRTLSGDAMMAAVEGAIATNEVNAAMGVICATPTAGSSGTLPGILFALNDRLKLTEDQMLRFLFTAGGMGMIIANKASIAGASGGCQAEVGSASAMGGGGRRRNRRWHPRSVSQRPGDCHEQLVRVGVRPASRPGRGALRQPQRHRGR